MIINKIPLVSRVVEGLPVVVADPGQGALLHAAFGHFKEKRRNSFAVQ